MTMNDVMNDLAQGNYENIPAWQDHVNGLCNDPDNLDTLASLSTLDQTEAARWLEADTKAYLKACQEAGAGGDPQKFAVALKAYMEKCKEAYEKFLFRQMTPEQKNFLNQLTGGWLVEEPKALQ